jgi:hypothetical protein
MNDQTAPTVIEATPIEDTQLPARVPEVLEVQPLNPQQESINQLLANGNYRVKEERSLIQTRTVEPAGDAAAPAVSAALESCVNFSAPAAQRASTAHMRNGKIARLPKLERDLVNKLLQNNTPYPKIVWALEERGIRVTERNISYWRTRGGYKEWCVEQENQIRLAQIQDHMTDYLRKHDAQQIPEVGLQFAATQLTSQLMNPETARVLLADPAKYAKTIETLDRITVRLQELQKERYETDRRSRIKDTLPNLRYKDERDVENIRLIASAEVPARSAYETEVPHRNHLPPREKMPRPQSSQTMGQLLGLDKYAALLSGNGTTAPQSATTASNSATAPVVAAPVQSHSE